MSVRPPVTPGAAPAAVELLPPLHELSGRAVLAGQHDQPVHGSAVTERATRLGGAVPALRGQEIGSSAPGTLDGVDHRAATAAGAVRWHRRGAVVSCTRHAVCPLDDEPSGPWFPGGDVVDALAVDTCGGHREREHDDALLEPADGRPVGFGEVGALPPLDVLDEQDRRCWSTARAGLLASEDDPAHVRAVHARERTRTPAGAAAR